MRVEEELRTCGFPNEHVKATMNVLFTASCLHAHISARLRPLGISHEQHHVLSILKHQHPSTVSQKAILHGMPDRNSNLTRIITKLKEKGLITVDRSTTDRREYMIALTPQGLELMSHISCNIEPSDKPASQLSESEAFHLNALLDKLRQGL